jgi:hypothetical protein
MSPALACKQQQKHQASSAYRIKTTQRAKHHLIAANSNTVSSSSSPSHFEDITSTAQIPSIANPTPPKARQGKISTQKKNN